MVTSEARNEAAGVRPAGRRSLSAVPSSPSSRRALRHAVTPRQIRTAALVTCRPANSTALARSSAVSPAPAASAQQKTPISLPATAAGPAVGLRKRGVGTTVSLAYWIGNPALNPAVLVFLFLVAPWQFGVVRVVIGVAPVVLGVPLVTRLLAPRAAAPGQGDAPLPPESRSPQASDPALLRQFPIRFIRSLSLAGP